MALARDRTRRLVLVAGSAVCLALALLVRPSWTPPSADRGPEDAPPALVGDPDGGLELASGAPRTRPSAANAVPPPRAARPRHTTRLLTGRVVGPDGGPPTQAIVAAGVHGDGAPPMDPELAWWRPDGRTGPDGRFGIPLVHGSRVTVHVATEDAAPFQATFQIAQATDADVGDLQLQPGAVLEGRLTVGGRPSTLGPPMLRVAPERQATRNVSARPLGARVVDLARDGPRLLWHEVHADAEGRWRLAGLVPGSYVVTVLGFGGVGFSDVLAAPPALHVRAPAGDADLDVDTCLVRVVPPAHMLHLSAGPFWIEATGPDGRQVRVEQEPQVGQLGLPTDDVRSRSLLAPSRTDLEVRAQFEGLRAWSTRVRTPAAGEVVTLVAQPETVPVGVVRLVPPPSAPRGLARLTYEAFEPGTSHLVARGSVMSGVEEPPEIRLPVGSHELRVRDPQERWLLEQRTVVDVVAAATDVPWAPSKGARIRAYVGPGPKEPIQVTLFRAGAEGRRLIFEPNLPTGLVLVEGGDALTAGGEFEQITPALEPGAVRLRFETPGFEPQETTVTLVAGEIAHVRVALAPSAPR